MRLLSKRIIAVALAFTAAGCAPELIEGKYTCASGASCPAGWVCRTDDTCWRTAGSQDAGADVVIQADGSADAVPDATCQEPVTKLDILLLVDNSRSMQSAQRQLALEIPRLIDGITSGDANGDGTRDFRAVTDLNLGVITPDLGTGSESVATCSANGNDAVLLNTSLGMGVGCDATAGPVVELRGTTPAELQAFSADAVCLGKTGELGCAFEQQLEAVLKALTSDESPTRFHDATTGHAGVDGPNAGFVRADAALLIVIVTDEMDCSASDYRLFSAPEPELGNLNVRCMVHRSFLHATSRYVRGLSVLKSAQPERLLFATLSGVPVDIQGDLPGEILNDPRMAVPAEDEEPTKVCMTSGISAFPAHRSLEVAEGLRELGHTTLAYSICDEAYTAFTAGILRELQRLQIGTCE